MSNAFKFVGALLFATLLASATLAAGKTHRVAVHIDQNDKAVMNLALNNVQNLIAHYKKKGEKVVIEVVAYGPGLHMFRTDTSPVKERVATMSLANPDLQFTACGNTHRKMSAKAGKKIALLTEAKTVPSGIVRLVELQEQGYAYVRP